MPLINGSLQIGKSAISATQAALSVVGNNMANAATASYSRQQVHMTPTQSAEIVPGKYAGTGVALYDIKRQVDEALNGRIRTAVGDATSTMVQQQALTRAESVFNELTEQDLSTRLNIFFQSWGALQNQPQDAAARAVVLQEGGSLCNFIGEVRGDIVQIQQDLDAQVRLQVDEASQLAQQIAEVNTQVVLAEAGRAGSAAALRDQRDDLLRQLSELINISTQEQPSGSVTVYVGSEPLVQENMARELGYVEEVTSDGRVLAELVFVDRSDPVALSSGKLHGIIAARDEQLGGVLDSLDAWTEGLVYEVNLLHSRGSGLVDYTEDLALTAANPVGDTSASLATTADTGLPWAVTNGVFYLDVTDSAGQTSKETIRVKIGMDSSDTTLTDLQAQINAVSNISATIDVSGRLVIGVGANCSYSFSTPDDAGDATNVLAVLGINNFFTGTNAADIAVSDTVSDNPQLLAASANGLAANGDVAGEIAMLGSVAVDSFPGRSVSDEFSALIGDLAAVSKVAQDNYVAADVVVQTLESERQGVSGVSLDEEAINMMMFQRAFQGAARYVSLIDQMLDEMLNLV